MAAPDFNPPEEIEVYCRFCQRVLPAQLERSIAGNGKTVDKNSTFEYYCTKCFKTFCFSGHDLMAKRKKEEPEEQSGPRDYKPNERYLIGEVIFHKKFKDKGPVIDKDRGTPNRILVRFEKSGLRKLVEGI
jgi:hypothetical protein